MMNKNQLSNKPTIVGISKNKIMVFAILVGTLLIGIIIYGSLMDDEPKNTSTQEMISQSSSKGNFANSADSIINTADQKIAKDNASQQLSIRNTAISESIIVNSQAQSNQVLAINNTQTVPPISNTDEQQFKTQQVQLEHQFKLKRIQNNYSAYSAKTLVYNGKFDKLDSSNTIATTNNAPNSSANNTQLLARNEEENNNNPLNDRDTASSKSGSHDQNDQKQKENFASTSANKSVNGKNLQYLNSKIQEPISPFIVTAGSVIPATMISGLNTDLPGQITAFVRENVYDSATHQILLIPQGSKLVGLYDSNVSYGQERILVAWNRLIYPDASTIMLKGMPGTDLEGYSGFYDEVDNHYMKIFGSSFMMGVITAGMQYSQNNTNANVQVGGIGVTTNTDPTVGQTLSGSLGQQLGQTGLGLTQKNLNIQPTLVVRPGYPFNVMTTADMILRPYRR